MIDVELIAALRENTAASRELAMVVQGLTAVLIEDREADGTDATEVDPSHAPTYMDGTQIGAIPSVEQ